MALTKNHAVALPYTKGSSPVSKERLDLHVHDELRKIEIALGRINALIPQAADAEPAEKFIGMQRFALFASWNPLGGAVNAWVYWNGTNWVAL
jgi:hypothetical protein